MSKLCTELWAFSTGGNIRSSPVVGDIDGDGSLEIVAGSWDNSLYCISSTVFLEASINLGNDVLGAPLISDIDSDGVVEILVGSRSTLYCLNLEGVASSGCITWGCYHGTLRHTGWADTNGDSVDDLTESVTVHNTLPTPLFQAHPLGVEGGDLTLSWILPPSADLGAALEYEIEVSTSSNFMTSESQRTSQLSYSYATSSYCWHYFRVRAWNESVSGTWSAVTRVAFGVSHIEIGKVADLSLIPGSNAISISWPIQSNYPFNYSVADNGTVKATGVFASDSITVLLENMTVGLHQIVLTATNLAGQDYESDVQVRVEPDSWMALGTVALPVLLGICIIIGGMLIYTKRPSSTWKKKLRREIEKSGEKSLLSPEETREVERSRLLQSSRSDTIDNGTDLQEVTREKEETTITNRDHVQQMIERGDELMKEGRIVDAMFAYGEATDVDPDNLRAWAGRLLMTFYSEPNGFRGHLAISQLDELIRKHPHDPMLLQASGIMLSVRGRLEAAETRLKEAFDRSPDLPRLARDLAIVYIKLHKGKEAYEITSAALRKTPDDLPLLRFHTVVCVERGHFDEAEDTAKKAAAIAPDNGQVVGLMAIVLSQEQKYKQALEYAKNAVQISPRDPITHKIRATTCMAAGMYDAAETELRTMLSISPNHPDALALMRSLKELRSR